MVLDAVQRLFGVFRVVDLERAAPNVPCEMIRVVLNRLKKSGEVWPEGSVGARFGGNVVITRKSW
jgi:hypothetical protein